MSAGNKASSKATAKRTRIVVLHLSPDSLAQFPSDVSSTQPHIKPDPSPSVVLPDSSLDQASDSNATPAPNGGDAPDADLLAPPETNGKKKKSDPGAVPPRKRAPPSIDPSKERGRPGPKKKPRLPDGSIDRTTDKRAGGDGSASASTPVPTQSVTITTAASTAAAAAAHKLGPKAHAGPINAGLRALDRTGKPCRKWERKGLTLKSFTGMAWGMHTWKAPTASQQDFPGDVKSDSTGGSSDAGGPGGDAHKNSSAVPSDAGAGGGMQDVTMGGLESSPAPQGMAA